MKKHITQRLREETDRRGQTVYRAMDILIDEKPRVYVRQFLISSEDLKPRKPSISWEAGDIARLDDALVMIEALNQAVNIAVDWEKAISEAEAREAEQAKKKSKGRNRKK